MREILAFGASEAPGRAQKNDPDLNFIDAARQGSYEGYGMVSRSVSMINPVRLSFPAIVGLAGLVLGAGSASAGTVTFDFGLLGADGGSPCGSNCVIGGATEHFFTTGGVTVGAIGFNASNAVAYVTQKPGAFGSGETGLGESDTFPSPSDRDYEVTKSTWLLLDNSDALSHGYLSSSLSVESLQTGEGAHIYAYTGPLTTLNPADLILLASPINPGTGGVTQTVSLPNYDYYVVQAYGPSSGADVVVSQEVFNTAPVPEPVGIATLGFGLLAMGFTRKRRSQS